MKSVRSSTNLYTSFIKTKQKPSPFFYYLQLLKETTDPLPLLNFNGFTHIFFLFFLHPCETSFFHHLQVFLNHVYFFIDILASLNLFQSLQFKIIVLEEIDIGKVIWRDPSNLSILLHGFQNLQYGS